MDGKSLSDMAVEYGMSIGAEYVEARFVDSMDENYIARNGTFLSIQKKPSQGIGVRVLVDGCMGYGSTDRLSDKSVKDLTNSVIHMAKLSERKEPIVLSDEKAIKTRWKVPVKIDFDSVSGRKKQEFIEDLDKTVKKEAGRAIKNRIVFLSTQSSNKYIATSQGSVVDSDLSYMSVFTMMNAKVKDKTEQRMLGLGGTAGWEWLKGHNVKSTVVNEAKKLVNTVNNARKVKLNKPVDVVVSGDVSGIMAHENVGHPSEADRIMGREGAQAGESFYRDLMDEGEIGNIKMGNDDVSIIDDPTLKESPGYYLYDDECVKARRRYLIKNGYLNELLLNRQYAYELDTKSNASARSNSYSREPIVRMSNTFFEPGDFTREELIEDVKKGILMKSFTEWNIDDRRFHSKYVGLEAYLIENGKVTDKMIKRPVLELTTNGILNSIDGVSKDYITRMAPCGKSDPMQPVPVSVGGPHLRMRNIEVG
ncbi:MAG: TldD/PmbA family protein [Thermoplasmata archaeon]